uniref:EF-hand domain-containing protein n=1 Tax=Lotharella oceanica TaxID=641309 RepID=A0A7S2XG22_9EUKA|mmetsp:Transcript_36373/g.67221  ORF Transcript_36373/g.67221 Transcript_36373/m.67221 type:complete len:255 (+) Transcript_36373:3-767(+)
MYLAILMLTGQGVPTGDLPWYTKMIVIATTCFSVAMFAIPSSMLTWGFEAEAIRMARSKYLKAKRKEEYIEKHQMEPPDSDSSSTDDESEGAATSDEEYLQQIVGIVPQSEQQVEETEEERKQKMEKEAKAIFDQIDENHSKKVTFDEFLKFWEMSNEVDQLPATAQTPEQPGKSSDVMPMMHATHHYFFRDAHHHPHHHHHHHRRHQNHPIQHGSQGDVLLYQLVKKLQQEQQTMAAEIKEIKTMLQAAIANL